MLLADKHLGIEQQTGLEQAVHSLIGTVYHRVVCIVLGQCRSCLVEFGGNEVVNLLARSIPVRIGSAGNLAAGRGVEWQGAAPKLEDAVIVPGTNSAYLGYILC